MLQYGSHLGLTVMGADASVFVFVTCESQIIKNETGNEVGRDNCNFKRYWNTGI